MKNSIYAVIMAGGSGERFWPMSRKSMPKQLLPIISKRSMLQNTAGRLKGLVSNSKIYIVTNKIQSGLVKKQLSGIPSKNIIVEPISKNTAPCIAVAATIIAKKDKNAVIIVLPADHQIKNIQGFKKTINRAIDTANTSNQLVTLGIKPKSPHTGYGYIKKGCKLNRYSYEVAKFAEKPNLKTAKKYVGSGSYLWNSGMFIWRAVDILDEIKKYLPKLYDLCVKYNSDVVYKKAENISIDYGIMENTKKAAVLEANFDWDDVGSWSALDAHLEKDKTRNIVSGKAVFKDVEGTIIKSDNPLIAVIGVKDLVIVAEKGAVLICPKERAEEVKQIVSHLKKDRRYKEYL